MADLLTDSAISDHLATLEGWSLDGKSIIRTFEFKSFTPAIEFVNEVADLAEDADHHPDIDVRWNKVTLTLSTHSDGGLTKKDTALATQINDL
jgi:4a-hydroxytetrahydrobiopterin dehydratase